VVLQLSSIYIQADALAITIIEHYTSDGYLTIQKFRILNTVTI